MVEIVLTAHPTQVNRRTLQYKHSKIAVMLQQHDRPDLTHEEREAVLQDLLREITSLWQTDELRRVKPTPVDGACAGGAAELRKRSAACSSSRGASSSSRGSSSSSIGSGGLQWPLHCSGSNSTSLPPALLTPSFHHLGLMP